MSVYTMCRDTVDIYTRTSAADSSGSEKRTFTLSVSGQRAKIDRQDSREGLEYGQRAVRDSITVFMPGAVTLTESDRIVWDSRTFEVRGVSKHAIGTTASYTRADAEEVTP